MIFLLLLILLSGFFEGLMDRIQFHYNGSLFSKLKNQVFWNPSISWKNKWKLGDPQKGPKFFMSTTLFVFITDAWHLFKFIRNTLIFISLGFLSFRSDDFYLLSFILLISRILYGVGFWLSYKKMFNL